MKLKILKTGKYSLDPALGPIVDFKEGIIDSDKIKGLTLVVINEMIKNGWASTDVSDINDIANNIKDIASKPNEGVWANSSNFFKKNKKK